MGYGRYGYFLAALLLPALASAADIPAKPADEPAHDIRVQVVAQTSAVIGAPMAGRLSQFPLHDGDRFAQGQVLARFSCAEKEAALAHARADVEEKKAVLDSKQKLHALGTGSEVDFQVATAEMQQAAAEVQIAQSTVDECTVTAPFAGRVADIQTHNYQFVALGAPLLEILNDKELELEMIVPSRWLSWLKPGIRFEVAIDETGKTYPAQLVRLSGKVDAVSRSVKVYGRTEDAVGALLPGMSGRALLAPPPNSEP